MTLIVDLARGAWETLRETLPSDAQEARCFLLAFWVTIGIQIAVFALMTLGAAWGTRP